ncbi:uncharacterized protein LOC111906495 isoform X3 [Lactuca sativa]|uniref:uncharacterized protein LOC111906495 isoform X3 n=1 Tax=Lactuca sativa TaxID=4236 RepID=UPI000CD8404B|nr:uncharacterized protein LOC111906495 isoform X3 [Lactuca sativa]
MDFHNMKRMELQALCKEHKIPANSANSVLIDKLSQLLNVKQEKQKPGTRQRACIKSSVEAIDESESAVSRRQAKKVRFSQEVEYERSGKKQKAIEPVVTGIKGRTRSVAKKVDEPAVDDVNNATDDDVQIPVKVTRSRAHILEKVDVVSADGRKQGRRAVKDVQKESEEVKETEGNLGKVTRSKANTVGKGNAQPEKSKPSKKEAKDVEKESEPVKETVVVRARVTRSKAQTVTEDIKEPELSPQFKKKHGRQTEKDEAEVELSKEVKDVPVRATRSRGQTLNTDSVVANPPAEKKRTRRDDSEAANPPVEKKRTRRDDSEAANPPVEKKRTRRDTIVVDLSHNTGNEDKGEKLGRGRSKKISEERIAEVPETQNNADKGTRQSRRNKATVEAPTVVDQDVSKVESINEKKVTRSKAPLAKKSSGSKAEVQQLEEPSEPAGRRNVNRRKSVMQPKVTEVVLPLKEPVNIPKKDTRRKSVVQKAQGKGNKKPPVGKKEIVKETEKRESPIRKTVAKKQSKDASEKGMKAVASGYESKNSRKRSGDPIVEDQIVKPEPASTRKESVAKKEQESVEKTPASKKVAMSEGNRSKKKAKLSEIKQSDSEDHVEKSISMETPILKMANLGLDDKVMETEQTPAIVESGRRFTRGVIRSDRKEPSQSAIIEQNTGVARFSSHNTPGRFTRSGIKVDEKEQPSESAHQSLTFDDALNASPEDAVAEPSPEDSIAVPTEVSNETHAHIVDRTSNLSALESLELPTIDVLSDGSHVFNQNQEVHVSSEIVVEAEVQVAVNSENSVVPEVSEKETELTISESTSEGLENDARVEEPSVSAVKTVEVQESDNISLEESDFNEVEALAEPSMVEGVNQFIADDQACAKKDEDDPDNEEGEKASNQKHEDVENIVDAQEMDLVVEGDVLEPNRDSIQESTLGEDKLQGLGMDENDPKDEKATVPESLTTHSEPEKEFDVVEAEYEPTTATATVTESVIAHNEPAKELESDIVSSAGNDVQGIPILGQSDDEDEGVDNVRKHESNTNDQDGESEQSEQEQLTSHYSFGMEDQGIGKDEPEPALNEKEPILHEVFTSSSDQGPRPSHNEDVPELLEDLTKSPDQKPEPSLSLAVDEITCDTVDASTSKEAPENPTLVDEEKQMDGHKLREDFSAQENPAIEESLPAVYTKEESTIDGLATNQLPGDIGSYKSPITEEESPVDDMVSYPVTSSKEEERNEQDLGNYSHGTDDFQKPASTNQSDDVAGQSMKDDQVPEFQTSAIDEASTPAIGGATVGFFNWSDSSLKELLKTPVTTQVSHAEECQQSVVRSALPAEDGIEGKATPYPDLSLKSLFTTPATLRENRQQSTVRFDLTEEVDDTENNATNIPCSSLKASLTTPTTTRVNYEKEPEENTVRFAVPIEDDTEHNANQNPDSSLKALFKTPATTKISHVQDVSSLKTLFATPATTRINRVNDPQENSVSVALPDKDDTEHNATQNPDSTLRALFKTPATTQISNVQDYSSLKTLFATPATTGISRVNDPQENSVSLAVADKDENATPNPALSLNAFLKTPATTRVSHVEEHQESLPDEDDTESNATQNSDLSLKAFFATPAITRVSHVEDNQQSVNEYTNTTQGPGSSLKVSMNTPATTQISHGKHLHENTIKFSFPDDLQEKTVEYALPIEDDMEGNAPQNPDLSVKTFATPATTWASHVENYQQSTLKFTLPSEDDTKGNATQSQGSSLKLSSATTQNQDLSLRTLFATQSTTRVSHVKEHEQSTVRFELPIEDDMEHNATENPDSSHKVFPKTPATTQRFTLLDEGSAGNATQNPDLSLRTLFATPSTTQVSYVQHSHQTTITFHEDEKQGTAATQDQGHDEDKKSDMNFQDFAHKYFDDDEVDYYHGEHSSNDQVDEIKQHNLPSEVAGTSHHDASGLKDRSFFTGEGTTQSPSPSENFGGPNFDIARKFFEDKEVDFGSSDNSGDEMKQQDTGRREM